jgi:hypothetical protein
MNFFHKRQDSADFIALQVPDQMPTDLGGQ